jgi:hypothetical protein
MGHFYHPPGIYLGRVGQPYDGRKGVNPSILNNPPPPPGNPIPNSAADVIAEILVAWQPPDARPWFGYQLNPVFLNNVVSAGGGWNSRDAVYQALFEQSWEPGPPLPVQRAKSTPFILPPATNPPPYSIVSLMAETVQAWQVTWSSPPKTPFPQPRATIPPPPGKRHHLWHIGPSGVRVDVKDNSEVDSEPPDT